MNKSRSFGEKSEHVSDELLLSRLTSSMKDELLDVSGIAPFEKLKLLKDQLGKMKNLHAVDRTSKSLTQSRKVCKRSK